MKLLVAALLVLSPGLLAQRGGGGRSVASPRAPSRGPASRPVYVPGYYPTPFYYGSGYATDPTAIDPTAINYGPSPGYFDPNATYPSLIVNPNYVPETAHPVLRDYTNEPVPEAVPQGAQTSAADTPSVYFLIAMKDRAIYPAIAYWVEDETLNYISRQGVRNRVSLDQVDREFSMQLNKERNIDFGLPPAKK